MQQAEYVILVNEQDECTGEMEKLAAHEPELLAALQRFHRAEERVRAALLAQTATLGVYEGHPLELARLLERERPLYRGRAVGWNTFRKTATTFTRWRSGSRVWLPTTT